MSHNIKNGAREREVKFNLHLLDMEIPPTLTLEVDEVWEKLLRINWSSLKMFVDEREILFVEDGEEVRSRL